MTEQELREQINKELVDLAKDIEEIGKSNMPAFNKGLEKVCAIGTKVEDILNLMKQAGYVQLETDEAICLIGEKCVGCSGLPEDKPESYCVDVARSVRAKLQARLEVAE